MNFVGSWMSNQTPEARSRGHARTRIWSAKVPIALLVAGVILGWVAVQLPGWPVFDQETRDQLAPLGLQLAVLTVGAALLNHLVRQISLSRAQADEDAKATLDLLRRTRAAHVRIVGAKRLLRAESGHEVYIKQMHALARIAPDLEDIASDVEASARLFTEQDRSRIVEGLGMIVSFLNCGYEEYVNWAKHGDSDPRAQPWMSGLIEDGDSMPPTYDEGLDLSKRTLRIQVYGREYVATKDYARSRLEQLNVEFGKHEQRGPGGAEFFRRVLDDQIQIRRANGLVVDKAGFIEGLENPANITDKISTTVEHARIYGAQAVVECVVDLQGRRRGAVTDGRYRNLRFFELQGEHWRCVAWFNAKVA